MSPGWHNALLITALPLITQGAQAQSAGLDCAATDLRPVSAAVGYRMRLADRRCEGFYQAALSSRGLEVVSVTIRAVDFDPGVHDHIVVSLPNLAALDPDGVRVRAVALPPKTHYRMDALLEPGQVLRWPVDPVLRPTGLTDARLGVYGWIGPASGSLFRSA